ncbi:MAG: VOC family protein [Acidimicrobiaceae bacterium]|nr:VOC family protein [Acidimicrobiaceae bacterium]
MTFDPLDALRLPVVPVAPRTSFAADLLRRIQHQGPADRDSATVRYFTDDLDTAVAFYRLLDFDVELRPSPAFAMLYRGDLRLLLSTPASHTLVDGTVPEPGGWNRISLRVDDLDEVVERLRAESVRFQSDPTGGVGVRLAVIEDPAGNPVELFQPQGAYHERRGETTS